MTNKHTRSRYKGVKWIDTRFNRRQKARRFLQKTLEAAIVANSINLANQIRSTKADTPELKVKKAAALAEIMPKTLEALENCRQNDAFGVRGR